LQTIHDILRERLLKKAKLLPIDAVVHPLKLADIEREVGETVWDRGFLELMWNRLLMGFLRYGPKGPKTPKYDYVEAIKTKLKLYEETGNIEMMVDIGNYAMLEYRYGEHPDKHFSAHDDVGHAKLKK
jgi:hypothetical protein